MSKWYDENKMDTDWERVDKVSSTLYLISDQEGVFIAGIFPNKKAAEDYIEAFKDNDDYTVDATYVITEISGLSFWFWNSYLPKPENERPWLYE